MAVDRLTRMEEELKEFEQEHGLSADGDSIELDPLNDGGEPVDKPAGDQDPEPANPDLDKKPEGQQNEGEEDPNSSTFKARWEALQGMHRSNLATIENLKAQIAQLTSQTQTLQTQLTAPAAEEDGEYKSPILTDSIRSSRAYVKMAKDYGAEYAELHFEGSMLAAQATSAPLNEQLNNIQATSNVSLLEIELTRLCPKWNELNTDPAFISWLNQMAPYSSKTLKSVLNENYSSGDAVNTAKIFNDFLQEQQRKPADPRAGLVAPGKSGGHSPTPVGNQPKIWTAPEIDAVYADYRRNLITDAEYNRLDAEIQVAIREGRVA